MTGKITLSIFFCAVSLFTLSWDVFGNFSVGSLNVKLSAIGFVFALITSNFSNPWFLKSKLIQVVVKITGALLLTFLVASLLSNHVGDALGQVARIIIGAFVPFIALASSIRKPQDLERCLAWFIRGMVLAACFGFYQLSAYYLHLPQLIEYTGISGGVGRISALSYEPATFGQMILMGMAAVIALAKMRKRSIPVLVMSILTLAAMLANTRALLLTIPIFLILIIPRVLSAQTRARFLVFLVGLAYLLTLGLLVAPNSLEFILSQFMSIFDPNEVSSNARRLSQYSITFDIISDRWLFGIGPGNLFYEVSVIDQNVFDGDASNEVIANNIWLQAISDGGIILVGLHVGLIAFVVTKLYSGRDDVTRTLSAAWLALVLVSGLVGSDFYTPSRWVLLAFMCIACFRELNSEVKPST